MLTDEEILGVVNHLNDRHAWYMDNLKIPDERFKSLCAEVGISKSSMIDLIDYILRAHTQIPPEAILENAPWVAQSMCHGVWAGIELGKKIAAITMGDE